MNESLATTTTTTTTTKQKPQPTTNNQQPTNQQQPTTNQLHKLVSDTASQQLRRVYRVVLRWTMRPRLSRDQSKWTRRTGGAW